MQQSFQSQQNVHRSIEQLKSKYDNLKTKARKDVAKQKSYRKETGGGPPDNGGGPDPVTESVLEIINIKTVVGLESPFDSDSTDVS